MSLLQGRIAIVTGAGSGFGEGIARAFAREGAHVVLADIRPEGIRRIADELEEQALPLLCDVSRADEVDRMIEDAVRSFGTPDILVNNAGITHRNQPMLDVDEDTFDRIYAVNVKSIYLTARALVPRLRARGTGGCIINVSSTAGIRPRPGLTWYNGTKGAVNTLTRSMALELGPDRIRVNAILPVLGATGLTEAFMGMPDTPENRERFLATIPLGRLSTAADIAGAAVYLASDAASMVTGVELPVDGGRTA
ncbi:SDR family oxidoreductase [Castellaniella sp. S9]|uniref:SDR family oxidoreductase n=1 Tax=Castellaniella sp. S9 TaxID=2993652 RepID=UPI0022B5519F|nr:SDR family oxidoreductase [Castellaniella sp. S9]